MKNKIKKIDSLTFEEKIKRLEEIQEKMDSSDLSLQDNLELFKESKLLIQGSRDELDKAEFEIKKVDKAKKNKNDTLVDF